MKYDPQLEDRPVRRTFISKERHQQADAETLAEKFGIGLQRARDMLKATTQQGMRSAILPISRQYHADCMYCVKRLNAKFLTDTMWAKMKSRQQNVASQIYSYKCGFN